MGLISPHLTVRSTEPCSGFWELLEGAGSGQYHGKRGIFHCNQRPEVHLITILQSAPPMCFDVDQFKEHPWEELQLEIQLHVPHGQSGHAELTLADPGTWKPPLVHCLWQELLATFIRAAGHIENREKAPFACGKISAGGNKRFTLAPFVNACQINT